LRVIEEAFELLSGDEDGKKMLEYLVGLREEEVRIALERCGRDLRKLDRTVREMWGWSKRRWKEAEMRVGRVVGMSL